MLFKENEVDGSHLGSVIQVKKERKKRAKSSFICHYCGYKAQSNPGTNSIKLTRLVNFEMLVSDVSGSKVFII